MRASARAPLALRLAPTLTLVAFGLPIAAGLAGTLLPAFGVQPALGRTGFSLAPWHELVATPGFATSLTLTLVIGLVATLLSLALTLGLLAGVHHRRWAQRLGAVLAPLLATPHSALAIGLAFMLAPSGWPVRWVSPGLTGWTLPPDVGTVGHPSGWPVIAGLLLKEVPYLVLMCLGALHQVTASAQTASARALGYPPAQAWFKVLLPQLWPQIRLPVYAVLAFSLSVVDAALILGPGNPPTLAVLAVRWFADPDLSRSAPAAAAAVLVFGLVLLSIGLARGLELLVAHLGRRWVEAGARTGRAATAARASAALCGLLLAMSALSLLALLLWSFAWQWRYPNALPTAWTLANWSRQWHDAAPAVWNTLFIGVAATLVALLLTLACLENEAVRGGAQRATAPRVLWLLYLPLLVPQVAFVFGAQVLLVRSGLDATLAAVVWSHLVFVLPYLFLSLADPWRAFDARYARSAASLGASHWRVFLRIKLPILKRPVMIACAVGFAVSVTQYLPTLFAGAGRVATLTTEAVTLSAGDDRRVVAVWSVLQALLPLAAFALAGGLPRTARWRGIKVA